MSKSLSKMFRRVLIAGFAALSVQMFVLQEASATCSVHDHNCQFHGIGRAVNPNIDPMSPTSVTIITEGSNSLDFDNNVLLPDGFGPYVVSSTGFGTVPGQPFITPAENARHVFPSQFQIDFQANTAQARHSGDLNGLEIVPGATGCQISTAANCEEISILGNIPDTGNGFVVQQQVHLFNAQNTPNPSIGTESYAVATGRAYIQTPSHLSHAEPSLFQENRNLDSLSGPRDQPNALGDLHTYTIGYNDFDPHAIGANLYFNQRWQASTGAYRVAGQHWYQDDIYRDVSTHRNKRFISGLGEESFGDYSKSTRAVFVGSAPSQAYLKHVAEQQRLARIEAQRLAEQKAIRDAKFQSDYDRGCRDSTCSNLNYIPSLGITINSNNTSERYDKSVSFSRRATKIDEINRDLFAFNSNSINVKSQGAHLRDAFYNDKLGPDSSVVDKAHAGIVTVADQSVQFSGGFVTGAPKAVGELQYFALDKGRYINPGYYLDREAYLEGLEVSEQVRDSLSATTENLQSNLTEFSGGIYDPNASQYNALSNSTGEFFSPASLAAKPTKLAEKAIPNKTAGGTADLVAGARLNRDLFLDEVVDHSFGKHVLNRGEFAGLGIRTKAQFREHVNSVIENPSSIRYYRDGRSAYLQESTGTVVVRNPTGSGQSTAFQPDYWNDYINNRIPDRTVPYQ